MIRVLAILLVSTGLLYADDQPEARKLFRIGASAYKENRFDAAAANFDRAWELYKAAEIAFSAAQAHRLQYQADQSPEHLERAIVMFEAYVAAVPKGAKRRDALAHLERLRDVRGRLAAAGTKVVVKEPSPSIYVSTAIDAALITIDGRSVDRYTVVDIEPGDHVLAISADGYRSEKRTVHVTKGQAIVPIELEPLPSTLVVNASAGARVLVDGRELVGKPSDESTGRSYVADPGERFVTVYARGRVPVTRTIELRPGEEMTLDVPLVPTFRRRAVRWVVGGSITLLGGALVTGAIALHADLGAADLRDSSTPLSSRDVERYETLRSRRDTFRTSTIILGSAAVATVGVALWLYYFDAPSPEELAHPSERPDPSGFTPLVSEHGAGMTYSRAW